MRWGRHGQAESRLASIVGFEGQIARSITHPCVRPLTMILLSLRPSPDFTHWSKPELAMTQNQVLRREPEGNWSVSVLFAD